MSKSLLDQLPTIVAEGKREAERIMERLESSYRLGLQTRELVIPSRDSNWQDMFQKAEKGSYDLNPADKPPTRQIDQALIDVVESCAARIKGGKKLDFEWFVNELMKHARPASLDEFKTSLGGHIYDNNSWMARYVLIQLDQLHHSKEYKPDFWARDDKGRFVWTVEHVLPQAEKLPDHWVKMIAGGDRQQAADLQDEWVHRLGKLTLSGYNSDLATAPFGKKQKLSKDRSFLGHKINIGYQNGLALNSLTFKTKAVSIAWPTHHTGMWK